MSSIKSRLLTAALLFAWILGSLAAYPTLGLASYTRAAPDQETGPLSADAANASTTTVNTTAVADNPNDGSCDLWETLNGLEVAFGGSGAVTVVNPAPGGGASNPAEFTIYAHAVYLSMTVK